MPWSRRRAFFFVSYQATRDVNAASLSSSVRSLSLPPIPQVRTPASLGAVFGGQTGAFGGVAVAPNGSNINPVTLKLLNAKNSDDTFVIPSPQTSQSGVNYTTVLPEHYNEDQFNRNFDVNLRSADHLSMKFFFQTGIKTFLNGNRSQILDPMFVTTIALPVQAMTIHPRWQWVNDESRAVKKRGVCYPDNPNGHGESRFSESLASCYSDRAWRLSRLERRANGNLDRS